MAKAIGSRRARDSESEWGGDAVAGGVDRRGATDLDQLTGVVTPARAKRSAVDSGGGGELMSAHRSRQPVSALHSGAQAPVVEFGTQKDEAVGNLEAGGFESCRGSWIDGRRANRGHRRGFGSERIEPRSQVVDTRQHGIVTNADMDERASVGCGAHHQETQCTGRADVHASATVPAPYGAALACSL